MSDYVTREQLIKLLIESNELLRSTNSIAERRGANTNWEAFERRVKDALQRQHQPLIALGTYEQKTDAECDDYEGGT